MIESRCGLECSQCEFKESQGCLGCVHIKNPFWGECPIKACCEQKELKHCGQCDAFPCDLLKQFAYDKKQGDDGARIKRCQCWKDKE